MGLFGDFVEVTTMTEDGKLDLSAMIEKTQEEMERGTEVICEASFSCDSWLLWEKFGIVRPPFDEDGNFNKSVYDDEPAARLNVHSNYCAVDILRKTAGGWAIYEVKSSSSNADADATDKEFGKYAIDIAYQKWVLEQCGVKVTGTYLVTLNKDYVRQGDLDLQQLFNIIDLKELVANEYLKVPTQTDRAHRILAEENEQPSVLAEYCQKPYKCAFWDTAHANCLRHRSSMSMAEKDVAVLLSPRKLITTTEASSLLNSYKTYPWATYRTCKSTAR
jgi:hypothetical protein